VHPLPATREDEHWVNDQTTINVANTAAGSGLHDADCWASYSLVDRDYSRSVCVPVAELINGYPDALNP